MMLSLMNTVVSTYFRLIVFVFIPNSSNHHCITQELFKLLEIKCHEQNNILIKNLSSTWASTSSLRTRNHSMGVGRGLPGTGKWTTTYAILSMPISSPVPQALYPDTRMNNPNLEKYMYNLYHASFHCQKFQSA